MKITIFLLLSLFLSTTVFAESDRPWWRVWDVADESTGVSSQLFTAEEKSVLRDYLRQQAIDRDDDKADRDDWKQDKKLSKGNAHKGQKPLPPGLQKKLARGGQLPPGWQKKVARGEVLDSDLYEVSENLPAGILRQLENYEGTSVRRVEDRVVRILDSTSEILDVITGRSR